MCGTMVFRFSLICEAKAQGPNFPNEVLVWGGGGKCIGPHWTLRHRLVLCSTFMAKWKP